MIRRSFVTFALLGIVYSLQSAAAWAVPTIWTGPNVTFSKAANADFTQAANQDLLTPNVKLTRGNSQGMINFAVESSFTTSTSPGGTTWATDLVAGNSAQTITATNYAALNFTNWNAAYSNSPGTTILNRQAVVHLVGDDIYLNLMFTAFQGGGTGGQFTYVRSTPVPEPGTLVLVGLSVVTLAVWQCSKRWTERT